MNDKFLVQSDRIRQCIASAKDIMEAKSYRDAAEAATIYLKRVKAGSNLVNRMVATKLIAERKFGGFLKAMPKAEGTRGAGRPSKIGPSRKKAPKYPTYAEIGVSWKEASFAQRLDDVPDKRFDARITDVEVSEVEQSSVDVMRELIRENSKASNNGLAQKKVVIPEGKYSVLVIDPPWQMEKIDRDCRGYQADFDYPTMMPADLLSYTVPSEKAADDCHVFLWTTQTWLPFAFTLLKTWGFTYCLTMVWHKPGGFQPYGLPQYNCEFALYGRKGNPKFVDTKDFPVCFEAPRGKHSEKPEKFYDLLRRVTEGPRLDIFNRREIEGFSRVGNE